MKNDILLSWVDTAVERSHKPYLYDITELSNQSVFSQFHKGNEAPQVAASSSCSAYACVEPYLCLFLYKFCVHLCATHALFFFFLLRAVVFRYPGVEEHKKRWLAFPMPLASLPCSFTSSCFFFFVSRLIIFSFPLFALAACRAVRNLSHYCLSLRSRAVFRSPYRSSFFFFCFVAVKELLYF